MNLWRDWKEIKDHVTTWPTSGHSFIQNTDFSSVSPKLERDKKKLPQFPKCQKDWKEIKGFLNNLKNLIEIKDSELQSNLELSSFLNEFYQGKNSDYSHEIGYLNECLSRLNDILVQINKIPVIAVIIPVIQALCLLLKCVLLDLSKVIQASTISRDLLHRLHLSIQTLSIRILTIPKTIQSF